VETTSYQVPLTITFSRPILRVTARAGDAQYEWNTIEAVGAGTVNFPLPAVLDDYGWTASWATVTGQTTKVILTPNDSDYVAYKVWVEESPPPCPPTGDQIADNKAFRDSLQAEYNRAVAEGLERAGWVYRNVTTLEVMLKPDFGTGRDACRVFGLPDAGPAIAGYALLASYHVHMIPPNETIGFRCPGIPITAKAGNGPSEQNGDLDKVAQTQKRHFLIDENELFIIQPNRTYTTFPWTHENGCR
jgi:hypothetical protein